MENQEVRGQVVSSTPGRLRVRLHRAHRQGSAAHRAKTHLQDQPGVRDVQTNQATGSVMVKYDPNEVSADDIVGLLKDIGIVAIGTASDLVIDLPEAGRSITSINIISSVDNLDRRLSRLTGSRVDLKLLFPAGLFALGIRQVLAEGLGFAQVPGYVLLWYAFDTFWKFHQQEPVVAKPERHPIVKEVQPSRGTQDDRIAGRENG